MTDGKDVKQLEQKLSQDFKEIGDDNIKEILNNFNEPQEHFTFKVKNLSSFTIQNPLKMSLKKAREFENSIIKIGTSFKFQEKQNNQAIDLTDFDYPKFENDVFKMASQYSTICGKKVELEDEDNYIYMIHAHEIFPLFMAVYTYFNYAKNY